MSLSRPSFAIVEPLFTVVIQRHGNHLWRDLSGQNERGDVPALITEEYEAKDCQLQLSRKTMEADKRSANVVRDILFGCLDVEHDQSVSVAVIDAQMSFRQFRRDARRSAASCKKAIFWVSCKVFPRRSLEMQVNWRSPPTDSIKRVVIGPSDTCSLNKEDRNARYKIQG
ncbi:hypothetical protein ACTJK5_12550 [Agrobacterium sp. 22094]|uniref:hypothetical protein n=1 Tax=Agrobacterium sp. 22094 TaxID=3453872 RepID=UPI003F83104C